MKNQNTQQVNDAKIINWIDYLNETVDSTAQEVSEQFESFKNLIILNYNEVHSENKKETDINKQLRDFAEGILKITLNSDKKIRADLIAKYCCLVIYGFVNDQEFDMNKAEKTVCKIKEILEPKFATIPEDYFKANLSSFLQNYNLSSNISENLSNDSNELINTILNKFEDINIEIDKAATYQNINDITKILTDYSKVELEQQQKQTEQYKFIALFVHLIKKNWITILNRGKFLKDLICLIILLIELPFIIIGGIDYFSNIHLLLVSVCMLLSSAISIGELYKNDLGLNKNRRVFNAQLFSYIPHIFTGLNIATTAMIYILYVANLPITIANLYLLFSTQEASNYILNHCSSVDDIQKNKTPLCLCGGILIGCLLAALLPIYKFKVLMMLASMAPIIYYRIWPLFYTTESSDDEIIEYENLIEAISTLIIFVFSLILCVGLITSFIFMTKNIVTQTN